MKGSCVGSFESGKRAGHVPGHWKTLEREDKKTQMFTECSGNDAEAGLLSRPWWENAWAVLCLVRGEAATEGCRVRKCVPMFSCGKNAGSGVEGEFIRLAAPC